VPRQDGMLASQTPASIRKVWAPKAGGAATLQDATAHAPLAAAAYFSSLTSLLGTAGQVRSWPLVGCAVVTRILVQEPAAARRPRARSDSRRTLCSSSPGQENEVQALVGSGRADFNSPMGRAYLTCGWQVTFT